MFRKSVVDPNCHRNVYNYVDARWVNCQHCFTSDESRFTYSNESSGVGGFDLSDDDLWFVAVFGRLGDSIGKIKVFELGWCYS